VQEGVAAPIYNAECSGAILAGDAPSLTASLLPLAFAGSGSRRAFPAVDAAGWLIAELGSVCVERGEPANVSLPGVGSGT